MSELAADVSLPVDLVDQAERQNCIVFVGPGVSIPTQDRLGPPGAGLLTMELAVRLGGQIDYFSFPWVAQLYADRNGLYALRHYVAERLDNVNYRPTPAHYFLAQLPFQYIVYTAQDELLWDAFKHSGVAVDRVVSAEALGFSTRRVLIQLYGTCSQRDTLLLTEDERRQVFSGRTDWSDFLHSRAKSHTLVFLGYGRTDPFFREFYSDLRPQIGSYAPRSYLIDAYANEADGHYWQQRHAVVLRMDGLAFLRQLADQLAQRVKINVATEAIYREPPLLSAAERTAREKTIQTFLRIFSPLGPVESGAQLHLVANTLAVLDQTLTEEQLLGDSSELAAANTLGPQHASERSQILLQLANIEWAEGNHERARDHFEDAISRDPNNIDALLSLYYLLVEINELTEAAGVYRRIVLRAPDRAFLPARYQIQEILGPADVGISYCVYDTEWEQRVTVTILRRFLSHSADVLTKFISEVSKINSEGVSRVLGYDRYQSKVYLMTEYVEGPTLQEHLAQFVTMSVDEGMKLANEVANALAAGQEAGVPHLNLRSDNIVLGLTGAVLVNYGFSRLIQLSNLQGQPFIRGGAEYQAPEQRAGAAGDARSDVYALATILYEMLVGRLPGVGAFQPIGELYPEYGEAIDLLIARMRDVNPERRFRSINEMQKEMNDILLSVRQGRLGRYLRLALSRLSVLYSRAFSRWGLAILFLVLLPLSAIAIGEWPLFAALRSGVRFILLLILHSLATSVLGYYIVRETARQEGLGSLLASGRGMGAVLGWCSLLWFYRCTDWGEAGAGRVTNMDFAGYFLFTLALVVVVTFGCLLQIAYFGRLTDRRRGRYTLGFYAAFIFLSVVLLLLSLLQIPFRMIMM